MSLFWNFRPGTCRALPGSPYDKAQKDNPRTWKDLIAEPVVPICANGRLINKRLFSERIFDITQRHDGIPDPYHKVWLNFWATLCHGDLRMVGWLLDVVGWLYFCVVPCSGVTSCQKGCEKSSTRSLVKPQKQQDFGVWQFGSFHKFGYPKMDGL